MRDEPAQILDRAEAAQRLPRSGFLLSLGWLIDITTL
jgi:hypothetical protein